MESDNVKRMTPKDSKEIEGQRILPAIGGVAALPAAGLVSGGPESAALFCLALLTIAAGYWFWVLTDSYFYKHLTARSRGWGDLIPAITERALHCQRSMIGYCVVSILASLSGFAAMHSGLRTPVSVEAGFLVLIPLGAAVIAHALLAERSRTGMTLEMAERSRQ